MTDGDSAVIKYRAGQGARKVEVYIDGLFQALLAVEEGTEEGRIDLTVPGLSTEEHEVVAVAYDRFLNRTAIVVEGK